MGDHLSVEAVLRLDSLLGSDPTWLDRRSLDELTMLFEVATSATGAATSLSFIDIASADQSSNELLASMFEHCIEWNDVWLASAALDHRAVDANVVHRAALALLIHVPQQPSPKEQTATAVVLQRLCHTGLLQEADIRQIAGLSVALAELLQAALAQWRIDESVALEAALFGEPQAAPSKPCLTELATAVQRYLTNPTDLHLIDFLDVLPEDSAKISTRMALQRIHAVASNHPSHIQLVQDHSVPVASVWARLNTRAASERAVQNLLA